MDLETSKADLYGNHQGHLLFLTVILKKIRFNNHLRCSKAPPRAEGYGAGHWYVLIDLELSLERGLLMEVPLGFDELVVMCQLFLL